MKPIVKLLLIALVAAVFLTNYKYISFSGGFKTSFGNDGEVSLGEVLNLENIYYYSNPFGDGYVMVVETSDTLYRDNITSDELAALKVGGIFLQSLSPKEVTVIPWYVYAIALAVILIISPKKR